MTNIKLLIVKKKLRDESPHFIHSLSEEVKDEFFPYSEPLTFQYWATTSLQL